MRKFGEASSPYLAVRVQLDLLAGSPGKWVAQEEQAGLARKVARLIPLGVVKG